MAYQTLCAVLYSAYDPVQFLYFYFPPFDIRLFFLIRVASSGPDDFVRAIAAALGKKLYNLRRAGELSIGLGRKSPFRRTDDARWRKKKMQIGLSRRACSSGALTTSLFYGATAFPARSKTLVLFFFTTHRVARNRCNGRVCQNRAEKLNKQNKTGSERKTQHFPYHFSALVKISYSVYKNCRCGAGSCHLFLSFFIQTKGGLGLQGKR